MSTLFLSFWKAYGCLLCSRGAVTLCSADFNFQFLKRLLWHLFLKAVVRGSHRCLAHAPSLHTTLACGHSAWKQEVQQQGRMGGVNPPSQPLWCCQEWGRNWTDTPTSRRCPGLTDIPNPLVMPLTQVWARTLLFSSCCMIVGTSLPFSATSFLVSG